MSIVKSAVAVTVFAVGTTFVFAGSQIPNNRERDFVQIKNPTSLGVSRIPVERVYLGKFYKPCIVRLPDDELRLMASAAGPAKGADVHLKNDHPIFRSRDGGQTWTTPTVPNLTGGEPYLTALRDGTLIMTGDTYIRDTDRSTNYYLHRSEDGGPTWFNPATASMPRGKKGPWSKVTSRNVLELADGSLMAGIGDHLAGGEESIWRSFDGGRTWSEKYPPQFEGVSKEFYRKYPYSILGESVLWQARSGKIYIIVRWDNRYVPPIKGRPRPDSGSFDQADRMILYVSGDVGRTWKKVRDFGHYGEMFPSILRLKDGRLLLTFTLRSAIPPNVRPLGVRAVLGRETEQGPVFDFQHDRLVLSAKTPNDSISGGGFGPTVQLADGTLVTAYSYAGPGGWRGGDFHSEVVRWRVPAQENETE